MHKKNPDGTYTEITKRKPKRAYNKKSTTMFVQDKYGEFLPISFVAVEQLMKIQAAMWEESMKLAESTEPI